MKNDKYQERYIKHQFKKQQTLMKLMKQRHSDRIFSEKEIEPEKIKIIHEMIDLVPSSCNRRAVSIKEISSRDDKALLGGLLVGGVGWIHRADKILLLIADLGAYKEKLSYMPYLDAGTIIQQIYLICTALGLGCCFVNPNIRHRNLEFFRKSFMLNENELFCGCLAMGYKK